MRVNWLPMLGQLMNCFGRVFWLGGQRRVNDPLESTVGLIQIDFANNEKKD